MCDMKRGTNINLLALPKSLISDVDVPAVARHPNCHHALRWSGICANLPQSTSNEKDYWSSQPH
jgi:hypothetical protein